MITNDTSFQAAQSFLLAAKGYWTTRLYSRLREEYAEQCSMRGKVPSSVDEVAEVVETLTTYRYFAWLERHLQAAKYSGRYGLVPHYRQKQEQALSKLEGIDADPALELDARLQLPAYYVATDIHQHPGGVWSEPTAGLVYEHGARTTTPLLGQTHADLHTRFTEKVAADGEPTRVLDMACGFGKSTLPFARRFPASNVQGLDLSEPCLRVAAHTARQEKLGNVRFRQSDASQALLEESSFDLVTSTMFLHEMPPKVLDRVFDECIRVLEPGGRMVHLDFWHLPDPFDRFLHYGHGRRNNEPYMQPLAELDLPGILAEKGFTDILIEPFNESSAVANGYDAWRFPWTVISARKPAHS